MPEERKIVILKDLEIGDIFSSIKDKQRKEFIKRGNCVFNRGAGSSTCACWDLYNRKVVNKMCRLQVVKIRESDNKKHFQENPLNHAYNAYNK